MANKAKSFKAKPFRPYPGGLYSKVVLYALFHPNLYKIKIDPTKWPVSNNPNKNIKLLNS